MQCQRQLEGTCARHKRHVPGVDLLIKDKEDKEYAEVMANPGARARLGFH